MAKQCLVYDNTTGESKNFVFLRDAKKWLKDHKELGHEVEGTQYGVSAISGDTHKIGSITI